MDNNRLTRDSKYNTDTRHNKLYNQADQNKNYLIIKQK